MAEKHTSRNTTRPDTTNSPPPALRGRNENHVAWLFRRIWNRLNRQNEHFMGVIVGQEGSGKSYSALKMASAIDPTFDPQQRVIFEVDQLLEVLRDGDHEAGQFWVLDEAGVQFGIRTWQDRGQILANQALQLIRNENLGLIFTLPRLGELDSQAQGRLQAFVEMQDKEDGEYVTAKWKWMEPDRADDTGTIYKKYPRRRINGELRRVTRVAFAPPADSVAEPYEERKAEFQQEFYEKTIQELRGEDPDADDADESMTPKELATEIADGELHRVADTNNRSGEGYINDDLVRAEYGTTISDARAVKSILERQFDNSTIEEHA